MGKAPPLFWATEHEVWLLIGLTVCSALLTVAVVDPARLRGVVHMRVAVSHILFVK
jgi:hypothetical protein